MESNTVTPPERKQTPYFSVCVAMCNNRGIGLKNRLPWPHLREDFEYYTTLTSTSNKPGKICARIFGRLTWCCVDSRERARLNTFNIVVTKESSLLKKDSNVNAVAGSFQEALDIAAANSDVIDYIWILGGQRIYEGDSTYWHLEEALFAEAIAEADNAILEEAVVHPRCERVYLTSIYADFESDTYFPVFEQNYREIRDPEIDGSLKKDKGIKYQFKVYEHNKS